ncbi:MAG: tetratricopeptide repeat protein [Candidatus Hydrogenedens sp.]|nr:tetratricopeptide repeat protein [Candidatus Hydrogenedens sp.]
MTEKHDTHHAPGHDTTPVWVQEVNSIVDRVRENPLPYIAGLVVILGSLAAGGIYQVVQSARAKDAATEFARAELLEDEAARIAALEAVAADGHAWSDEALYLVAEDRLAKKELDAAGQACDELLSNYPDSPWAPRAAEGLAYIDELNGSMVDAIGGYERVRDQWPDSFTARMQSYNIARAAETMGDMKRAVDEYQKQLVIFPDSKVADKAQTALDRLRNAQPDLFPDAAPADQAPNTEVTTETAGDAPAAEAAPEPAADAAPAEGAAATEAPDATEAAAPEAPAEAGAEAAEAAEEPAAADPAPEALENGAGN